MNLYILLLTILLCTVVKVDADIFQTIADYQHTFNHYKNGARSYLHYVDNLVYQAKKELHNGQRASTEYSADDIIYHFVPYGLIPPKEDSVTVRRQIFKAVKTSPKLMKLASNVQQWMIRSSRKLKNVYVQLSIERLLSIEDMSSIENVYHYMLDNRHLFDSLINEINKEFDDIVVISGPLRKPFEYLRYYLVNTAKEMRDSLHVQIEDKLRGRCNTLEIIALFDHFNIDTTWNHAYNQLTQSPMHLHYWIDLLHDLMDRIGFI
ncbi:hypothetical protein BDB01DRAFT_768814 [Pilobolus umbonatus]|nr:hypothetical protein BDB01DRAFT_768814 [Pilobolus umbonatus]